MTPRRNLTMVNSLLSRTRKCSRVLGALVHGQLAHLVFAVVREHHVNRVAQLADSARGRTDPLPGSTLWTSVAKSGFDLRPRRAANKVMGAAMSSHFVPRFVAVNSPREETGRINPCDDH